jgi:hypothetical protein
MSETNFFMQEMYQMTTVTIQPNPITEHNESHNMENGRSYELPC